MSGHIIYEGQSTIDGKPIVVIMTGDSSNRKTGDMMQTWIMRSDIEPNAAAKSGEDSSVCGSCPLRWSTPKQEGSFKCYVVPGQAPLSIYRAFKRGIYKPYTGPHQLDTGLRLGSYGDPTAVPIDIWPVGRFTTGYTHQWQEPFAQPYKGTLMASVNTMDQANEAMSQGWKIFATWKGISGEDFDTLVTRCPSDKASGLPIRKCDACRLCDGHRANVWIAPH